MAKLRREQIVEREGITYLDLDGHLLQRPPKLADLLHRLSPEGSQRTWNLQRIGTEHARLFPGRAPDRAISERVLRKHFHNRGISALAGHNRSRMALAAELPAPILADLTGINVTTALQWSRWAQNDWHDFIATRKPEEKTPDDRVS
ncbi:hypothetical protein [Actinomadura monticuli]|uniref:Uncharacterized protein n=1 Tax=Actinomadura monticuli TaxID=3097367 RepID=A0ABV4QQQ5_9ACTN